MVKKSHITLDGIFTPLAVPFNEQDEIDPQKMTFNIDKLNRTDLSGYVVLGSNGEYVYLK